MPEKTEETCEMCTWAINTGESVRGHSVLCCTGVGESWYGFDNDTLAVTVSSNPDAKTSLLVKKNFGCKAWKAKYNA